jgi:hypothetical protein
MRLTLTFDERIRLLPSVISLLEPLLPKGYYWDGLGDITLFVNYSVLDAVVKNPDTPKWLYSRVEHLRGQHDNSAST